MRNWINTLEIRNFKSIKNLELHCKRINVFVGRPNVGKSNILEGIAMTNPQFTNSPRFQDGVCRYEDIENLFYDQNTLAPVVVGENGHYSMLIRNHESDNEFYYLNQYKASHAVSTSEPIPKFLEKLSVSVKMATREKLDRLSFGQGNEWAKLTVDGTISSTSLQRALQNRPKYYTYKKNIEPNHISFGPLSFPNGENLFRILREDKELRKEVAGFFQDYGLDLVFDSKAKTFEVHKRTDDIVYKTPYSLVADTLQRIIFYLAAIASNKKSILLFEEPETHSFPPYVTMLAEKIIDSKTNQFFIATHSPYLLTTLMTSGGIDEVSVNVVDIVNHETKVRVLTEAEMREMLDFGVDIFYNLNWFEVDGAE